MIPKGIWRSGDKEKVQKAPFLGRRVAPYFLIENKFDDREWISNLVRLTVKELSEIQPKTKRKKK